MSTLDEYRGHSQILLKRLIKGHCMEIATLMRALEPEMPKISELHIQAADFDTDTSQLVIKFDIWQKTTRRTER